MHSLNQQVFKTKSNIDLKFIALMALMMSMVALGIDVMLPALQAIGDSIHVTNPNDNQLIISAMFLGLSIGQMIFGPISDTVGRTKSVYVGFVVFGIGCFVSLWANDLFIMLIGRTLQGFGLAAFRVVCLAIIRDRYAGNQMARVASFIMTIFILVPTIAPLIGQQILLYGSWQSIFYFLFFAGLVMIVWFAIQQKETLAIEDRIPLTFKNVKIALTEIFRNPIAFGYTIISGLFAGAFLGFLNTSQQVFEFQYELGTQFPLYFAIVAMTMGTASVINGFLVRKYDMHDIAWVSMIVVLCIALLSVLILSFYIPNPNLSQYLTFLLPMIFFTGLLFGNLNSIAMNPLGKIAGIGAAVIGSVSTFLMVLIGALIGRFYVDNTSPILWGFAACALVSLMIAIWAKPYTNAIIEKR